MTYDDFYTIAEYGWQCPFSGLLISTGLRPVIIASGEIVCQCPLSGLLISTLDSRKPHSIRAAKAKIARVFQSIIFFVTICRFFCFFEIEVFFVTHLILFSPLFLFYHSYSVMPTNFLSI